MIDLMKISKDRRYPARIKDGIREAIYDKINTKIEKIFPKIGLKNSETNLSKKDINKFNSIEEDTICEVIEGRLGIDLLTRNVELIDKVFDLGNCDIKYVGKFKKLKVVFSNEAWDIATMSERGIESCMSWDSGNSRSLCGSIIDPCAAVIYLTDGSKFYKKDEKMLARAVIRFIVVKNEARLFIEDIYINKDFCNNDDYYDDDPLKNELEKLFSRVLKNKTKNLFRVETGHRVGSIPLTPEVSKIDVDIRSYCDSELEYTNEVIDLNSLIPKKKTTKKKVVKSVSSRRKLPVKQTQHA